MNQNQMSIGAAQAPSNAQETLGSMLTRLSAVINHTVENVSNGDKIFSSSLSAAERLGFVPQRLNGISAGVNKAEASGLKDIPTTLQQLDGLINLLGNTNDRQRQLNDENDVLRSALEGQL